MSKLNIDQRSIRDLLTDKKSDFLIPDYQRPYAWGEDECSTLWDDLFAFAFPGDDYERFDSENDEYFLGPFVTFKNASGQLEIIDGQQRLTTIMLLLRAFYDKFANKGRKDELIRRWKVLEAGANAIFRPMRGTPVDELFTRYMYYRRARLGIRDTTTASLRDFFGADGYAMLKEEGTLGVLEALLGFCAW